MPAPELPPPRSSLPEAAAHFGAHVLASAAAGDHDAPAATGGAPGAISLPVSPVVPAVPAAADAPGASPPEPVAVSERDAVLERLLRGPNGLGTAGLRLFLREEPPVPAVVSLPTTPLPPVPLPVSAAAAVAVAVAGAVDTAEGTPVPGLYYHPVPEPDPERVEEVSRRIKAWAVDEVSLFPDDWEKEFDGFSVGRYMVACHPDAPTVDHLMLATRLMVAENAVDDCYCEDHGGSPDGLGERLLLAHTALDPLYTTAEYQPSWAASLQADAPRRAYHSAMEYFVRAASASQADRLRHDMARLHLGYLAEAAWAQLDHVPEVWEYLAMRQFNNFRPCPTITDTVGGYELPADLHAQAAMQKVIALAGNATTIVNDLYSYTKELDSPGHHLNLPVVIAEREGLSERDAYLKSVEVHNDLMHDFESEAAALTEACPSPHVQRFLRGVAAWVDGNHYWHRTNTFRYRLPDFW
ncbi:family 2 encapsulin nanocompartment cargo protein terpene cyclase [Streptomyces sp. NBC_00102]|uniref:family 2 encapsulin nanocompartment cargo protein terpene cyclase n=1 Tax=Streptomyces sp. NBC_00102 TaxID=2975652 RepID=UPI00224CD5DE|nr:family 2 encapsulin nanocompartment cargo protein terpene cyclase [Streptomyces sp. NBC_00102]MCX5401720.1 family 2 encapsulin nanocompartment cargo protein terpene cyclase [Streptomyces sp. NBC_00102]